MASPSLGVVGASVRPTALAAPRTRAAQLICQPATVLRVSRCRVTTARCSSAAATEGPQSSRPNTRFAALALLTAQRLGASFTASMTQAAAEGATLQQRMKLGASVVPVFAAIGSSTASATLPLITSAVASFIKLYLLLLFVRVLLTWFPNVDWMGQPWVTLRQVTDPYLNLFRNLIPPLMGQIDFTPIFGFLVLQFLVQVLGADDMYSV